MRMDWFLSQKKLAILRFLAELCSNYKLLWHVNATTTPRTNATKLESIFVSSVMRRESDLDRVFYSGSNYNIRIMRKFIFWSFFIPLSFTLIFWHGFFQVATFTTTERPFHLVHSLMWAWDPSFQRSTLLLEPEQILLQRQHE